MKLRISTYDSGLLLEGDLVETWILRMDKRGIDRASGINEESGLKLEDYGEIVDEDTD